MKEYLYDVFLSFTGADRELKNRIKEYLGEIGLSYYDSDLYCKGQFRQDFCEALDKSRVYLMLLTDNLRNDPTVTGTGTLTEVRRECSLACELEARNELNIVILCTSEFFKFSSTYHDYNDTIGWFFYSHTRGFSQVWGAFDEDGALSSSTLMDIGSRCASFVESRNNGKPQISQKPRIDIAENKLPERGIFVGREDEIKRAIDAFSVGKQAVVLSGMGGIGKTELAIEIARHTEEQNYLKCPQIVHISDYNDSKDFLYTLTSFTAYSPSVYSQISALCEHDKYERKLRALSELPETVLLVVDNCNSLSAEELKNALSGLKCRLLITTRAEIEDISDSVELISVGYLEKEQAHSMFVGICAREVPMDKFTLLYNEVGGHTITLCIMAKLLRVHEMSIDSLLGDMEQMAKFDAKVDFRHNESGDSKTVLEHLQSLFRISNLTEGAIRILRSMSILSGGSIATEELMRVLNLKNRNEIIELTSNGWLEARVRIIGEDSKQELYLHPILSRLMAALLKPTEENVSEMIDHIAEKTDGAKENLTYKNAIILEDRLFYACYVLAGVSGRLCESLWNRFVSVNRLLGDTGGTEKRVSKLSVRLIDQGEQTVVGAYGDMITIEQYPTRVDILEKYLDKLSDNAANYKWLLRSLSVTFAHIEGVEEYRGFLFRATDTAFYAAIEREDDFAIFDLLAYVTYNEEKTKKYIKDALAYVKRRKKAGVQNGTLEYIELLCNSFLMHSTANAGKVVAQNVNMFANLASEKYGDIIKMVIRHPVLYARLIAANIRIWKLDEENDPVAAALKIIVSSAEDYVADGLLDANAIIEAAVQIHRYRLEKNTTLQSASVAALGVIGFLQRLPEATVRQGVERLVEGVDMDNLSVASVSNLQVAALINTAFGNSVAVNQARQLVDILRRLRPEGHTDIISAVIAYGDACVAFGKEQEALKNYLQVLSDVYKKDSSSLILCDVARKMIRLSALSSLDFSQIRSIKDVALLGLSVQDTKYWDIIRSYTARLLQKALMKELSFASDEFKTLIGELASAAEDKTLRDPVIQRTVLYTIFELGQTLVKARELDTVAGIIDILEDYKKRMRGTVRFDCNVRILSLQSFYFYYKGEGDHLEYRRKVIALCIKNRAYLNEACIALQTLFNFKYTETDDPLGIFVKNRKLLSELRRLEREYNELVLPYDGEISSLELAARMLSVSREYYKDYYGIKGKEFRKIRSCEAFYALAIKRILEYMIANYIPPTDSGQEAVELHEGARANRPRILSVGTGRNDLCPCGSGKKYKHCCGVPKEE